MNRAHCHSPAIAALALLAVAEAAAQTPSRAVTTIARENGFLRLPAGQVRGNLPAPQEAVLTISRPAIRIRALAFSPDGLRLASAGRGEVVLWNLEGARIEKRLRHDGLRGNVYALAFAKDGRRLFAAGGRPGRRGVLVAFDPRTGEGRALFAKAKDVLGALALSPDDRRLAAASADGSVYVFEPRSGALLATLKEHRGWVQSVAFSPDGGLLATGGADRTIAILRVADWKVVKRHHEPDSIAALAFSPDGQSLAWAVSGLQSRLLRWRPPLDPPPVAPKPGQRQTPPAPLRSFDQGGASPLALAFAAVQVGKARQHRLYAASSDGALRVYVETGQALGRFATHGDWAYAVAASPDGERVATGAGDGTILVWEAASLRPIATLVQLAPGRDESLVLATPAPPPKGKKP